MNRFHFSVDLGGTLLDRSLPTIPYGLDRVMQMFPGALGGLTGLHYGPDGSRVSVIATIKHGQIGAAFQNLAYHQLTPHVISAADVEFCYSEAEKAHLVRWIGADLHVDSTAEALNMVNDTGIVHKVLFAGSQANREEQSLITFEGCHFASNWDEVFRIICDIRTSQ